MNEAAKRKIIASISDYVAEARFIIFCLQGLWPFANISRLIMIFVLFFFFLKKKIYIL